MHTDTNTYTTTDTGIRSPGWQHSPSSSQTVLLLLLFLSNKCRNKLRQKYTLHSDTNTVTITDRNTDTTTDTRVRSPGRKNSSSSAYYPASGWTASSLILENSVQFWISRANLLPFILALPLPFF